MSIIKTSKFTLIIILLLLTIPGYAQSDPSVQHSWSDVGSSIFGLFVLIGAMIVVNIIFSLFRIGKK